MSIQSLVQLSYSLLFTSSIAGWYHSQCNANIRTISTTRWISPFPSRSPLTSSVIVRRNSIFIKLTNPEFLIELNRRLRKANCFIDCGLPGSLGTRVTCFSPQLISSPDSVHLWRVWSVIEPVLLSRFFPPVMRSSSMIESLWIVSKYKRQKTRHVVRTY